MFLVGRLWIFMKSLSRRIEQIRQAISDAEYIVIGAGAGLSTAAGIDYGGERFKEHFGDYIKKYDMTDMYTAGFYPFDSLEEKWVTGQSIFILIALIWVQLDCMRSYMILLRIKSIL